MALVHKDRGILAAPVKATIYEGRVGRTHTPSDALQYASGPEHRDIHEVQNIVNQLAGLPIYLGHPAIFPSADSGEKIVGRVLTGKLDSDSAVAEMAIMDDAALSAIRAGTHELSLGYACVLDDRRYQRNIKLDHLALVERARCGSTCSLRADNMACTCDKSQNNNDRLLATESSPAAGEEEENQTATDCTCDAKEDATKECTCGAKMKPEMMADKSADSKKDTACKSHAMPHNLKDMELQEKLDAALAEIETLKKSLSEAEAAKTAADAAKVQAEIEAANAKKDSESEKTRADEALKHLDAAKMLAVKDAEKALLEKARTDAAAEYQSVLNERVNERVELITAVSGMGIKTEKGEAVDLAKLSVREIKVAAIKHVDGEEIGDDKPDAFVDGVFSGALKRHARAAASRVDVRQSIVQMRNDQTPVVVLTGIEAEKAAKLSMVQKANKAWTTPKATPNKVQE